MNLKDICKKLLITVLFLYVNYILSKFEIPLLDNRIIIRFTFIVGMLYACYFNIWWCIAFGMLGDVVPFLLFPPSYPFFVGYTISAVIKMMIDRYFLYSKEIKFKDVLGCRLCVNMIVNMLLGSLWIYMMYFDKSAVFLGSTLLKNLLITPAEAGVFYVLYLGINKVTHIIREKRNEGIES